ncbi:AAA family ATPase [Intestinimonas butyriciproducens]|uniref:AAA family ATPase n=1 Tax=Intestinimonas butyriciproducens TaxID=1297617 RepID=UPI002A8091CF|nr:AAA family ATPase [Intestinimonas butyriciproducens]MDY3616559.1 AAA family ATPase [Intestinimonas butyriciproducens]
MQQLTDEAPETLRFSVLCQRLGSGLQEQLEDFLRDYPQTRLVIIDTLQKVRDGTVNRGSMYASDYDDMAALKAIADRHNLCMILVHHLRKLTDSSDPFNEVSGSTALMGAADTTYLLKKSNRAEEEAIASTPTT